MEVYDHIIPYFHQRNIIFLMNALIAFGETLKVCLHISKNPRKKEKRLNRLVYLR